MPAGELVMTPDPVPLTPMASVAIGVVLLNTAAANLGPLNALIVNVQVGLVRLPLQSADQ
jgi:hypothetical protein